MFFHPPEYKLYVNTDELDLDIYFETKKFSNSSKKNFSDFEMFHF